MPSPGHGHAEIELRRSFVTPRPLDTSLAVLFCAGHALQARALDLLGRHLNRACSCLRLSPFLNRSAWRRPCASAGGPVHDSGTCAGVLRAVQGSVVKCFRHPVASVVLSDLYEELPAAERNAMVAEFYSREWSVLGGAASAAGGLASLTKAWPDFDSTRQREILKHLILALQPIIEKGYVDPVAIHRCATAMAHHVEPRARLAALAPEARGPLACTSASSHEVGVI